ncbi:MAG: DNA (cytosine-5-)-methyltransferase [Bacillota bacterium]
MVSQASVCQSHHGLQLVEESAYFWRGEPRVFAPSKPPSQNSHKLVDLFCGLGGISIGFEWAGFEPVLGLDIHVPSVETYRHSHPTAVTILGDVRKIIDIERGTAPMLMAQADSILRGEPADVIAAGIPCQGFSLNNRKRSPDDHRNYLFLYLLKAVELLKPKCVLVENVPAMSAANAGQFVCAVEASLREMGYTVESRVLNAADFGVPQIRKRLFFLAFNEKCGSPILWPEEQFGPGRAKPYRTVGEAISDLPSLRSGEAKSTYASEPLNEYQRLMRLGCGNMLSNHEAPRHPPSTIQRIAGTPPGQPMYPEFPQRIRLDDKSPSPTQVAGGIRPQFQFGHPWDARGLSVRERCRLQSIPDRVFVHGGIVQGRVQTGNAVPPLLARELGRFIRVSLDAPEFRSRLLQWWSVNARHFPWREGGRTPYEVFIAEFLLRKTKAERIVDPYRELLKEYPRLAHLARASEADLVEVLKPLGLHHIRAGALIKAAQDLAEKGLEERVPTNYDELVNLPHVGKYIANAVLCFATGEPRPLVDANVQRVFSRMFSLPTFRELHKADVLWRVADGLLDRARPREYNWALLDFAAIVCTHHHPKCAECPLAHLCDQHRADKIQEMVPSV